MKLPSEKHTLEQWLSEFDVWITPALGDIRDSQRFKEELADIVWVFETMGKATNQFETAREVTPSKLSGVFTDAIRGASADLAFKQMNSLAKLLYLVTAKTDNNAKCQLPIFLRQHSVWSGGIPTVKRNKLVVSPVPRVLKADAFMSIVVDLAGHVDQQRKLLEEFVSFILDKEQFTSQLWAVGRSYFALKPMKKEKDLLSPLVVFQIRGSFTSSGGHDPENILRLRMLEWGLLKEEGFNSTDVICNELLCELDPTKFKKIVASGKTRAYDFVLPYKTVSWLPVLFIQCQFYAGDSGSVSHKNVDQTRKSRDSILKLLPSVRFVEYVDGAGYFSSLNGDLKSLLSYKDTNSFFQVRSASIRLRRELQEVGFLTPLEVEQAILRTDGSQDEIHTILSKEGYKKSEIERCLYRMLENESVLRGSNGLLVISDDRRPIVRRYLLLDSTAKHGRPLSGQDLRGSLLIPGYGPFFGLKLDEAAEVAMREAPILKQDWKQPGEVLKDIRWLCDQGMAMAG